MPGAQGTQRWVPPWLVLGLLPHAVSWSDLLSKVSCLPCFANIHVHCGKMDVKLVVFTVFKWH